MRPVDVAAERLRTPGTRHGHHLNAAGSSLPTVQTLDAVIGHLRLESRVGGYEAAAQRAEELAAVYTDVAELLGAASSEIALTDSATTAMQRVLGGFGPQPGAQVVVTPAAYVSVALHLLALRESAGIGIRVAPVGEDGALDLDALAGLLADERVRLLIGTHVPTSSGAVEPVRRMGELANAAGVPFVVDATQSVGQLPVRVAELGCSALVATGRKFLRGPRGTGVLWIAEEFADRLRRVTPDVRGAHWTGEASWETARGARRFETWEASHALRLGLGVAARQLTELGIDAVAARLSTLAGLLREELAEVPGVVLTEPDGAGTGSAIVTFTVPGRSAREVRERLAEPQVWVTQVPAEHAQWDLGRRRLAAVVRASVHIYNTTDDIEALTSSLRTIAAKPASSSSSSSSPAPRRPVEGADVVVVGMGVHGASAVEALARRGLRVIALEQFGAGHDRGSSHGETRMIRRAYPSPVWAELVEGAYEAWESLAARVGRRLMEPTGGLFVRAPERGSALDGPDCRVLTASEAAGLPIRVASDSTVVHDPAAGVLRAGVALEQLWRLSRSAADVRTDVRATRWLEHGGGVEVHTTRGVIRVDHLVLCPGPWLGTAVPELAEAVAVQRIVNLHVRPVGDAALPENLPVFSVDSPAGLVYGIPPAPGRLLKIGLDEGPVCDPDGERPPPTAEEERSLLRAAAELLGVPLEIVGRTSCLYSVTEDRRFLVGALPGRPAATVVSACSGHGFKFGPVLGEAVADLVTGVPRPDLDFLDPARCLRAGRRAEAAAR